MAYPKVGLWNFWFKVFGMTRKIGMKFLQESGVSGLRKAAFFVQQCSNTERFLCIELEALATSGLNHALHLFYIDDKVARSWQQPPRDTWDSSFLCCWMLDGFSDWLGFDFPILRQGFYKLWLCMPLSMRLGCYFILKKFGNWLYGPTMAL